MNQATHEPPLVYTVHSASVSTVSGRALDGEKTLQEESIRERDELILIRKRLKEPSDNSEKDNPVPEVAIVDLGVLRILNACTLD